MRGVALLVRSRLPNSPSPTLFQSLSVALLASLAVLTGGNAVVDQVEVEDQLWLVRLMVELSATMCHDRCRLACIQRSGYQSWLCQFSNWLLVHVHATMGFPQLHDTQATCPSSQMEFRIQNVSQWNILLTVSPQAGISVSIAKLIVWFSSVWNGILAAATNSFVMYWVEAPQSTNRTACLPLMLHFHRINPYVAPPNDCVDVLCFVLV